MVRNGMGWYVMVCDGMYVMVYGCICKCMYACMHVCMYACMHVSHVCIYVRTYVYCIGLLYWSIVLVLTISA